MTRRGKCHATPALDKAPGSGREVKALHPDLVTHEGVQTSQQAAGSGIVFEFVQRFRVNAVRNQRRTNPVTRNVAH
jgi:hypothetical protein